MSRVRHVLRPLRWAAYHQSLRVHDFLRDGWARWASQSLPLQLNRPRRACPVIVSLTSIPSRIPDATAIAITSMFFQQERPDGIVLWLDEGMRSLPLSQTMQRLVEAGLDIRYVPDIGPHTKLVYALDAFPDSLLISADDDRIYGRTWLSSLLESYRQIPQVIHCHRALWMTDRVPGELAPYNEWQRMAPGRLGPSHRLFQTATSGVLYPPGRLPTEATNIAAMRRLCPTNDDIWFKAMALYHGTPVKKVNLVTERYPHVRKSQRVTLWDHNIHANEAQVRATFTHYGLLPWREPAEVPNHR